MRSLNQSVFFLAIASLFLCAPTWGAESSEVVDLARFGKAGDLKPTVAESFIAESFYTQDMTAAAASREYYTAVYSVPSSVERPARPEKLAGETRVSVERAPIMRPAVGLALSNPGEEIVDVTVSLRFAEGVRNHLVRVEAGDSVGVGLADAPGLESIVLLAFAPFEARVELGASGLDAVDFDASVALDVMAPAFDRVVASSERLEKVPNYCQTISSWLRITGSTGGYVIAYGNRFQFVSDPASAYFHEIEYPAGTLFHRASGASRTGSDPACKWYAHRTIRTDQTKTHSWTGMDDLVIACNGPATAVCMSGCSDYFTVSLSGSSLGRCF